MDTPPLEIDLCRKFWGGDPSLPNSFHENLLETTDSLDIPFVSFGSLAGQLYGDGTKHIAHMHGQRHVSYVSTGTLFEVSDSSTHRLIPVRVSAPSVSPESLGHSRCQAQAIVVLRAVRRRELGHCISHRLSILLMEDILHQLIYVIPLFTRLYIYIPQVVQDFFHQQYHSLHKKLHSMKNLFEL